MLRAGPEYKLSTDISKKAGTKLLYESALYLICKKERKKQERKKERKFISTNLC